MVLYFFSDGFRIVMGITYFSFTPINDKLSWYIFRLLFIAASPLLFCSPIFKTKNSKSHEKQPQKQEYYLIPTCSLPELNSVTQRRIPQQHENQQRSPAKMSHPTVEAKRG